MRSHVVRMFGLVAVGLVLASSAQAQRRGHDRNRDDTRRAEVRHGDVFVRDMRGDIYRTDRRIPPGLAKKPGGMPPGQYKKRYGAYDRRYGAYERPYGARDRRYGTYEGASVLSEIMRQRGYHVVRVVPSGESRYVYYRLRDGNERRAFVGLGPDRLQFDNVPTSILQAVVARLY